MAWALSTHAWRPARQARPHAGWTLREVSRAAAKVALHWLTHDWKSAFAVCTHATFARAFDSPPPASSVTVLTSRTAPNAPIRDPPSRQRPIRTMRPYVRIVKSPKHLT